MQRRVTTPRFDAIGIDSHGSGAPSGSALSATSVETAVVSEILDLDRMTASRPDGVGTSHDGRHSMHVRNHVACYRRRFEGTRER